MKAVMPVSLFSLCLVPLTRSCWCIESVVSAMQMYFKSQVCDYYVNFFEKGSTY